MKTRLTKAFKTLSALTLTAALSLTAGISVSALNSANINDDATSKGVISFDEKNNDTATLSIPKGLTLLNEVEGNYYIAAKSFSYTISAVSANDLQGKTIKDADGNETQVEAFTSALSSSNVWLSDNSANFTAGTYHFTPTGETEITDQITVSVKPSGFSKIGIYRFKISDTTSDANLNSMGIQRSSDYRKDRYLDVYINSNSSGFVVSGFVLLDENRSVDADEVEGTYTETNTETGETTTTIIPKNLGKSSGYIRIDEDPSPSKQDDQTGKRGFAPGKVYMTDTYTSYNFTVTQDVAGTAADENNPFPVVLSVGNNVDYKYMWVKHQKNDPVETDETDEAETPAGPTYTDTDLTLANTSSISSTLKKGETITIYGLHPKATVKVKHENNTYDAYKLTMTNQAATTENEKANILSYNSSKVYDKYLTTSKSSHETTALNVSTYSDYKTVSEKTDNYKVDILDFLNSFSPTGLELRFAPFIIVVAFGAAYLIISRRTKKTDDAGIIR